MAFLKKHQPLVKQIAKDNSVSISEAESIIEHLFWSISKSMADTRMPKILLRNFGVFKPEPKKINYNLYRAIKAYKKGTYSREKLNNKIKQLWPIKQRILKEKLGHSTYKKWANATKKK